MTLNAEALELAARAICEADPLSPAPDAPILIGSKRAKAWEPRAAILRQAIEAGLFSSPPRSWLAPNEATPEMVEAGELANDGYNMDPPDQIFAVMRTAHLAKDQE
jgi:hypothetical protein